MSSKLSVLISLGDRYMSPQLNLLLMKREGDKCYHGSILWNEASEHMYVNEALLLNSDVGQELIDSLWSAGVRPTEGNGSVGSLAATERHLSDMQKLVFAEKGQCSAR